MKYLKQFNMMFLLLLCSEIIFSCNQNKLNKQRILTSQDSIRDVDSNNKISSNSFDSTLKDYCAKISAMLGLDDLRYGFNGEQIRIWLEYALSDSGKVIILKNQKDTWNSTAFYFKFNQNENYNLISIDKRSENSSPISGWNDFLKKIDALGIYNLKDYKEIPNYFLCTDGDAFIVEIAKNSVYKIYAYPCIEFYADSIKEVKNVKQVLSLIQKEFRYKLFPRPQ